MPLGDRRPVGETTADEQLVVLCLADGPADQERLAGSLAERPAFDVRTETTSSATARLDDVDCVVVGSDVPDRDAVGHLRTVRERRPTLPTVLCSGAASEVLVDAVTGAERTELVTADDPDAAAALLADRVERLVDAHRTALTATRAMASLQAVTEAVAVVDDDGRVAVLNRAFARRLGEDRATLRGRDWRTCFTDDEAERLESTALERLGDDWRWTGSCVCERPDGSTFGARARFTSLESGGFAVSPADGTDE